VFVGKLTRTDVATSAGSLITGREREVSTF
jgi:hypothetical protein